MGKHRAEPPPRVRPRVGRLAAATLALVVTGIALLGGMGAISLDAGPARASTPPSSAPASGTGSAPAGTGVSAPRVAVPPTPTRTPAPTTVSPTHRASAETRTTATRTSSRALPPGSGTGRRIVFSMSDQRVWLVDEHGAATSTYLVSGSVTHNLQPGRYDVYSRSRWAVGVDDSGVMQFFVRFAHGPNAAIGFHSIPTKNGTPLQTESQLGTPQSHGCIRQRLADAERLWAFAPVGTDVVVLA